MKKVFYTQRIRRVVIEVSPFKRGDYYYSPGGCLGELTLTVDGKCTRTSSLDSLEIIRGVNSFLDELFLLHPAQYLVAIPFRGDGLERGRYFSRSKYFWKEEDGGYFFRSPYYKDLQQSLTRR